MTIRIIVLLDEGGWSEYEANVGEGSIGGPIRMLANVIFDAVDKLIEPYEEDDEGVCEEAKGRRQSR